MYDACLTALLAGDYTVALSQYDNFATGPNLSDGFSLEGAGNFTAGFSSCTQAFFCDFSDTPVYTNRTNVWAYDVLNVPSRDEGPGPGVDVPEPAALSIFSLGLLALLLRRRKPA
jgi:hypothetical protein